VSQPLPPFFSRIAGTGSFLPRKVLTNKDLEAVVDTSDEWIYSRTGIRERHIAAEGEMTSDLALHASRRALEAAGIGAGELDLIIVATVTPDIVFPSTACLLQAKLGVKNVAAFDLQAACTGFVYGLNIADQFIRSGQYRHVLVVGAEAMSRIVDWQDRATCVLFGDGAGAAVLTRAEKPGMLASFMHADGSQRDILEAPGQVCGGKVSGRPLIHMEGNAVFKFAVRVLGEVAEEALATAKLTRADIDWLIPHQANIRIIQAAAKKLDLPMSRVVTTVERHANTSAASIPLALDEAMRDGRLQAGQRVMFLGVGAGFTWGATLVQI
jgi:3-oxoacyl-[acyl-carrier-protein] synthase-3